MIERPHAFGEEKYSFLDNVIYFLRRRQVVRALPPLVSQRIADLGAGYDARLLRGLLNQYKNLQGVAFDFAFDEKLSTEGHLQLVLGDLNTVLAKESASVDVCISLAVLEHLDEPQLFLSEIYRILAKGGRCVLTTPGPTSKPLLEFLAYKLKIIDATEIRDHKNYFSSKDLERMFQTAGFDPSKIHAKTFLFGMNNVVVADK